MVTPPWVLDSFALGHIAELPGDQKEYGWATFQHYYYNSYKVPCVATFLIWGLFVTLILMSGLSALVKHYFPHLHRSLTRRAPWWRGNISEHPLISQKHSQVVTCGKGCFRWLTLHLPLRLESIILVAIMALNIVPLVTFYSLYVGHNTYFPGTDTMSRRSQILRHLANRCAMLGIGQLPMLILLASRRTPVAILSQLSMSTMMLFHRWIARICYLHVVIHIFSNALNFYHSTGLIESLKLLPVQLGIVSTVMLSGLVFSSLRIFREKHYEVFVFLHISLALLMIVFTYLHIKFLHQGRLALQILVIELTAAFWAFDRTLRLLGRAAMSLSWRYADGAGAMRKAELTSYGNGAYTRMRIQVPASRLRLPPNSSCFSITANVDLEDETKRGRGRFSRTLRETSVLGIARIGAGDDIRITIPKLQWVGEHPFSVFAVGRSKSGNPDMGYLDLIIQRQSGLTQKLSRLAQAFSRPTMTTHPIPSDEYLRSMIQPKDKQVKVAIDGPFGKSPTLKGAQHAVLIAGGIGITFCYPLLVKAARGEFSSLETCKLIWIVRDDAILDVLRSNLTELLEEIRKRGGSRCQLSIDVYVTVKLKSFATQPSDSTIVMVDQRGMLPTKTECTLRSGGSSSLLAFSKSETHVSLLLGRLHSGGGEEREEVALNYHVLSKTEEDAKTPYLVYTQRVSSPQYSGYRIGGEGKVLTSEMQTQYTRSDHSNAWTVYSTMQPDSPHFPERAHICLGHLEELNGRLIFSQDVLAQTRGDAIEINRFQGRPKSMAAVHGHINKQSEYADGRIAFATCGPASMCDSVRAEVVALLKEGVDVALVEDCFNW
ncbi:related to FRE6 - Ferric reductase [Melanopsichium pennsylvanicum]|uniref:Related to FRE6 - Ferric reductase n=1 Tax=Melanopsichium pennsylvanicum TaxID=63383 RepID=A0AAJ5C385_9BASI|nr:related to FRE6 - Ferric reductase [Melanopsichium pennsylvanicum]